MRDTKMLIRLIATDIVSHFQTQCLADKTRNMCQTCVVYDFSYPTEARGKAYVCGKELSASAFSEGKPWNNPESPLYVLGQIDTSKSFDECVALFSRKYILELRKTVQELMLEEGFDLFQVEIIVSDKVLSLYAKYE